MNPFHAPPRRSLLALTLLSGFASAPAIASTAFGDINNFDVFNDTGQPCHGFEIELEDVRSTDITYTFDWNHYGAPRITEDNSDPAHPKVTVRYEARYDATRGSFSAYTAVPAAPPAPTDGHMCTDPSVNIGCEHFGVGYYGTPSVVRYHWLVENPVAPGTLSIGPAVNIATPSFVYYPPVPQVQPVAQVQAVIQAPQPEAAPVYEFGDAVWVKEIRTTSHNNNNVELRDLVSDDPNDPNDVNWTNGEPDEVEVEWQIMQTEFANANGVNNELAGANEDLPGGDEVVTRRYEFYQYSGPFDPETHEVLCEKYPAVADPAALGYKPECDPAQVTILGDYIGAQMAGFNVAAALGLIDHVQDGEIQQPFTPRSVVVGGNTPYAASLSAGALPAGLFLDPATGVLSGTPTAAGVYAFTVSASDADAVQVSKAYTMTVVDPAIVTPAQFQLAVEKTGSGGGTVSGNGMLCGGICATALDEGTAVSLTAVADVGSVFDGWSGGPCVGTGACGFSLSADTTVTASFSPQLFLLTVAKAGAGSGSVSGGGIDCGASCAISWPYGSAVSLTATPSAGSVFSGWSGACTGTGSCELTMSAARSVTATFAPLRYTLSVTLNGPAGAGTVSSSPAGINCGTDCQEAYIPDTTVKLTAQAAKRRQFVGWSGACSGRKTCTVVMSQARNVTATFK